MNLKFALKTTFILSVTTISYALAQDSKPIRGVIVMDGTKDRIEQVEVSNQRSGYRVSSDRLGLFELACKIGDTLRIEKYGYQSKKIAVQNFTDLYVLLKITNQLKEVSITGKLASQSFKETSNAYSKEKGIFYGGKPPIGVLFGSPVTFFYELLGKDGRRVRRLNQLAKQAAEAEEIGRYFNDFIIQQAVPIDSAQLEAFKMDYTPKLDDLKKWSAYDRASYIKTSFEKFRKKQQKIQP